MRPGGNYVTCYLFRGEQWIWNRLSGRLLQHCQLNLIGKGRQMNSKAIKGIAFVLVRGQVPDQGALNCVFAKLLYLSLVVPHSTVPGCWLALAGFALANPTGLRVKLNTKF
jgi:hypothetical protein